MHYKVQQRTVVKDDYTQSNNDPSGMTDGDVMNLTYNKKSSSTGLKQHMHT